MDRVGVGRFRMAIALIAASILMQPEAWAQPLEDDTAELHADETGESRDTEPGTTATIRVSVSGMEDGEMKSIKGARVELLVPGSDFSQQRRTTQQGRTEIDNVPAGRVKVRVVATGWEADVKELNAGERPDTVEFVLDKLQPPADEDKKDED